MSVTMKQVAARANVSVATVSYVLNGTGAVTEATKQRVLAAVSELNYQPHHAARSMRGRSYTIGLTLPAALGHLANPTLSEFLSGLSDAIAVRGYYLLLATVDDQEREVEVSLDLARTGRVDGLVLLDVQVDDARAYALAAQQIPHVCAGLPPDTNTSPFVSVDGHTGSVQAIQHLLNLGHRRIGLIQLPSELADSEPRYLGYAEALESVGLELDPLLVVEAGRNQEDGYQAMDELLGAPEPPTAVLACNDELAFGAMHAAFNAGLEVGRDISVVGFDDVPLAAHVRPALTTLRQPRLAFGEQIAMLLVDAIERRERQSWQVMLETRLVIRQSTGPCSVVSH